MRTPTKGHSLCEVTAPSSSRPQESQKDGEHSRLRETAGRWAESGGRWGVVCAEGPGDEASEERGENRPSSLQAHPSLHDHSAMSGPPTRPSRRLAAPGAAASDGHAARPRPWRFQARGARTPRTATRALLSPLQLPETSPKPGCARSPSPSSGTGAGRDTRTPGFSPPVAEDARAGRRWPLTSLLCSLIKCFRGPCPVLGPRDARPGDSPARGPLLVLWETKHGQDSREVQGQGHVRALWERSGGAPESGRIGAAAHLLENEAAALSGI